MYRWLDEYKQDGANAFPGKGKLKPDDDEIRRLKRKIEDLQEENEILKKQRSSLQDTQMKYIFMYEHRFDFRVKKMAEVLEVKRSGYYAWVKAGNKTKSDIQDEYFLGVIRIEFKVTRETYGPRRLSKHLKKKGVNIGWNRVARLMRGNNILPKTVKKFKATTNSNHNYPVAENILNRNFIVSAPCKAWVCDITYVATGEG